MVNFFVLFWQNREMNTSHILANIYFLGLEPYYVLLFKSAFVFFLIIYMIIKFRVKFNFNIMWGEKIEEKRKKEEVRERVCVRDRSLVKSNSKVIVRGMEKRE